MAPVWYRPAAIGLNGYVFVVCTLFLVLYWPRVYRWHPGAFMLRAFAVALIYPAGRALYVQLLRGIPSQFRGWVDAATALGGPFLAAGAITWALIVCRDELAAHARRLRRVAPTPTDL